MKPLMSSLTSRMLIGILLLQFILFPVLFGGLLYIVKKGYETQFIDHVRSDAYILASTISSSPDYSIIEDAFLSGRITYAEVIDSSNNQIYSSAGQSVKNVFKEDFYFGGHNDNQYNLIILITDDNGKETAKLRVSYDESSTRDQIDEAFQRGLLFALIYILVSVLFTVMLGRRLTKPIEHLRDLSREIAHGQFHQEITVTTKIGELSSLARTLEFMRTELMAQTKTMKHQALHDALTGLPNRSLLHERIDQALFYPVNAKNKLALVLIDLDQFKEINDSFGHLTGDNVLMEVSGRLRSIVRQQDIVTRLGGDEFAVLLPTADEEAAVRISRKMFNALLEPMVIDKYSLRIGASLGIVIYPEHGDSFESLLGNADVAMYAAKHSGGGIKVFNRELSQDAFKNLTIASDLREAIEQNQFFTVFQPKQDIKTGQVNSAEALVRWNHPEKGLISPADFIPIAEKTGIISGITKRVVEDVIHKLGVWREKGFNFSVSINLSALDLENKELSEYIVELLDKNNLPPEYIELEITESAIITDPLKALESLDKLHKTGIKIALDDFGTGYSSLVQLRRLPISIIKIDRSFVFSMTKSDSDRAIVRATISMAHDLGLKVVAEGPEDKETIDALKLLECDMAQGYYISRPLEEDKFIEWMENNHKILSDVKLEKTGWLYTK